ncbi:unnamed protein product [Spirodela intermedia]|uniref:Bifunctional inhibitor/plant lipid transfer protein/seed storage helical domain-containing protein n=2 Tax=Spirodela intermedia TaxID=51605 RepID=A0A7I8KH35_SPIIN|nr:unnamed protein product [Spirodela intermedia]CAA6660152.1 unnamed protein product [Spirodela intermedia]CAA7396464.1 unnamed protein product [Spirodela intermedia]CAA7396473.1 unnamed protein product [Spirodela intermedia]
MGRSVHAVVLVLVVVVALALGGAGLASAGLSASECRRERVLGLNACKSLLFWRSPSPECCLRIRVSHPECVCPVITPKLAALVDVNRLIKIVRGCGRPVPSHYKCGSITTP